MNVDLLKADLEHDEGRKPKIYFDSLGVATAGIGRNMRDVGLSDREIEMMLENDIHRVMAELDRELPWWQDLDDGRQRVLANMCFQLGIKGLTGFRTTLSRIQAGKYDEAAESMRDSLWYKQTPNRVERLMKLMRTGA